MNNTSLPTIRLQATDNVVVARVELPAGTVISDEGFTCGNTIPAGHKAAAVDIAAGEPIRKYGQIIGSATVAISRGEHVHTHNVHMLDFDRDPAIGTETRPTRLLPEGDRAVFQGFIRGDGRIGTRNYIGILPTVSCSAGVARLIADKISGEDLPNFPRLDGVIALGHDQGCGIGETVEGFKVFQRTMNGLARHPNFAGLLLLGLGCEVCQIDGLMAEYGLREGPMFKTLNIQDAGGTPKTVAQGADLIRQMLPRADATARQPVSAEHLVVGLECGGSDAYSGISANPALGAAADLVVRNGGTVILSETPEIYGAEHLLTRRAASRRVGEKLIERIQWWEEYTARLGGEIDNNPSPGNKAGGLTTILEKSLGAAAKGGTTNLEEVLQYAEPVTSKGLVFMDTPGYDVVSITGMTAGGANVVCFTTGRGTVCGGRPVPSIKIASNSPMYHRMSDDMDVNCGTIVDGEATIDEMGRSIFNLILETASGQKAKSELWGLGENEFVPWQLGPIV